MIAITRVSMNTISIKTLQSLIDNDPEKYKDCVENEMIPCLESCEPCEPCEPCTYDMMEYIDSLFLCSGFIKLQEKECITSCNIARLYVNKDGLCVSIKCGIAYKSSFLYDEKVYYMYPNLPEIVEYISKTEDTNVSIINVHKFLNLEKILPETFDIIIYNADSKNLSKKFIDFFKKYFDNSKSVSLIGEDLVICMSYVTLRKEHGICSIERLAKLFSPDW